MRTSKTLQSMWPQYQTNKTGRWTQTGRPTNITPPAKQQPEFRTVSCCSR